MLLLRKLERKGGELKTKPHSMMEKQSDKKGKKRML